MTQRDFDHDGYVAGNLNLIAWASRNLLELTVFTKYVLKSGANARRFGDDRLIDGCELIVSLRDLEHFYDPIPSAQLL
jgi:hypothetical protein